ncbi:MAG: hypothetical protein IKQ61_13310 [Spirochaetales bacterium]|nr:hypothetical protein [Spirochaetales bacterium]
MKVPELRNKIQNNQIDNLYLFTGPEVGEKREIIDLIVEKVFGEEEPVVQNVYLGSDLDPAEISEAIEGGMLFSSKKIVCIKNIELMNTRFQKALESVFVPQRLDNAEVIGMSADRRLTSLSECVKKCYTFDEHRQSWLYNPKTKETDRKKLIQALAHSKRQAIPADTYIIMINETNEKIPTSVTNLLSDEQQVVFYEMYDSQKPQWIRSEFQKRGLYIEDGAIEFIVDTVENNKYAFQSEIERICTYYTQLAKDDQTVSAHNVVSRDLIESYLYHSKEETAFSLYSALLAKNAEKALSILDKIFYTEEDNIVPGLMWSHKRFLKILNQVENERLPLETVFEKNFVKMKKAREELAVGVRNYKFYQTTMLTYQIVQLEYYSRFLPSDLKRVKYQEFIINFIFTNNLELFWLGDNQVLAD